MRPTRNGRSSLIVIKINLRFLQAIFVKQDLPNRRRILEFLAEKKQIIRRDFAELAENWHSVFGVLFCLYLCGVKQAEQSPPTKNLRL